jgi:multidrug efflux pump subunit AcrA (membrane-fusion protein)
MFVALAIVGGAYWASRTSSANNGENGFTLASVEYGLLTEVVSATGLLQPQEVVAVGSPLSGEVVEIFPGAEINKTVKEGDPLLRLDDRNARLTLDRAKTAILSAKKNVEMAKALRDGADVKARKLRNLPEDVGQRRELDEAEMQLKAAEASVGLAEVKVQEAEDAERQAQYGLDLTVVRVPRIGPLTGGTPGSHDRQFTILDRKVVLGQLIAPPASAQLFTLASDLGQMQVHAQVSENDIGKIQPGLAATFTVYAYQEEEGRFRGKVAEIRSTPTNLHGAVFYDAVIDVTNERDPKTKEWRLRSGMTAAVDVILRQHGDVWKMPTSALSFQLDEQYQTDAAKGKLSGWQSKNDHDEWRPVWILDQHRKPLPIFVRVLGKNSAGETGISDGQFNEVLDWDPELQPKPDPRDRATYPQVLTGAPPVKKRGILEQPNVKLF